VRNNNLLGYTGRKLRQRWSRIMIRNVRCDVQAVDVT